MKRIQKLLILGILCLVSCNNGKEQKPDGKYDYLVSSAAELTALTDKVKPGDVIAWANGEYSNVQLTIGTAFDGTEGKPVTLKALNPGGVVFNGSTTLQINANYFIIDGFDFDAKNRSIMQTGKATSHDIVRNCRFDGTKYPYSATDLSEVGEGANTASHKVWFRIYGYDHEVCQCSFINKNGLGMQLTVELNGTAETGRPACHNIHHNAFTRPFSILSVTSAANGQECIRVGSSTYSLNCDSNCNIHDNYFYNTSGEKAEIISNKSTGNLIENNLFYDSLGGLVLRHGNKATVRGNYFWNDGKDPERTSGLGVRIIGEDHLVENNVMINLQNPGILVVVGCTNPPLTSYWQVKNTVCRNNVIQNCKVGLSLGVYYDSSSNPNQVEVPLNVTFENNVIRMANSTNYSIQSFLKGSDTEPRVDLKEFHFKDNVIFGGRQSAGYNVPTTTEDPKIGDYTEKMQAIAANAGIKW